MGNREIVIVGLMVLFSSLMLTGCAVQTPPELMKAVGDGDLNKTKSMLEEDPKLINSKSAIGGYTLLQHAVIQGDKDMCEILIANGAKLEAKNRYGKTALCLAVEGNHRDIVEFIVAKGANVNSGMYPIIYTYPVRLVPLHEFDWDIARFLVAHGAEINTKSKRGRTPLHTAAHYGPKEIVRLFLDKGADVNAKRDSYGWPKRMSGPAPLHDACWRLDKNIEVVELLIAGGADINAKCYHGHTDGWTPLHIACSRGHTKAVELLVEKGADVDARTGLRGYTPLHIAVWKGYKDMAGLLISNGADVNAKASEKYTARTPLYLAARYGRTDMVELLIANGAEVNARNSDGDTALDSAVRNGHKETAKLLRKHGGVE